MKPTATYMLGAKENKDIVERHVEGLHDTHMNTYDMITRVYWV